MHPTITRPFLTVELLRGRALDQRREFARRVTEAAVETLAIDEQRSGSGA